MLRANPSSELVLRQLSSYPDVNCHYPNDRLWGESCRFCPPSGMAVTSLSSCGICRSMTDPTAEFLRLIVRGRLLLLSAIWLEPIPLPSPSSRSEEPGLCR